jgi:hypothetical protein
MQDPSLLRRVEILEGKVEQLERLPARMDALELQILQFREEVRVEFSATREELRAEMRALHADAVARAQAGDEETRRFMRILHEEVIERIARIGEGRPPTS